MRSAIKIKSKPKEKSDFFESIKNIVLEMPNQLKKPMDKGIVVLVLLLSCFGLLMIWSASMYNAKLAFQNNEFYFVKKQLTFVLLGLGLMWVVSIVNYKHLRRFAGLALGISLILLLAVMLFVNESSHGASRWITIGGVVIQPAELAKVCVLLFVAREIEKRQNMLSSFKGFVILLSFTAVFALLIYQQPALSTAIIVAGLIIGMYFMAGGSMIWIVLMAAMAICVVALFIYSSPWRLERVLAFLDPWSDLLGKGWQPAQSLMALGSGGIFGQGIGNGKAKLMFLPEPQNDYIFSIIGEEMGLLGCVVLILVYFLLIFRLIRISLATPDIFGRLLVSGMALLLGMQVFLNIAVVTNLVPPTGVMLPFISYGGSSLVTLMLGIGVCLNVSRNVA
ncbi:MAG: putative lipid II flippase FtsW [Eubacteriaceae bacterium]|nr:putative lipid II flippase FtsW [Eubacteriaceae bacterium]